jgi:CHASE2 domain-containing sensor protein/predicted Ser/Thr protein kinase
MKRFVAARFLSVPLIASLALSGVIFGVKELGGLESAELGAYDLAMRSRNVEGADPRILVVGITAADIKKYAKASVPIVPDEIIVQALKKLMTEEAMVVGVDLVKDVAKGEILTIFQDEKNQIIPTCSHGSKGVEALKSPEGVDPGKVGYIDIPVDADGIVRRISLFDRSSDTTADCQAQLALPMLLSETYLASKHSLEPGFDEKTGNYYIGKFQVKPLQSNFGGYGKTETTGYPIMLNYRDPSKVAELVSLEEFLAGKVTNIKDRIVLIGSNDPASQDIKRTPYSAGRAEHSTMQGVMVLAQATSQMVSMALDNRSLIKSWPEWTEGLWLWGWALAGGSLALLIRHPGKLAGAIALTGVGTVGSFGLLFLNSYWVPVVAPLLGLGTSALAVYAWRNYGIDREQQRMQKLAQNQGQTIEALQQLLAQQPVTGARFTNAPAPGAATTAIPAQRLLGKRYQTTGILGAGGFATTYMAEDMDRPSRPKCAIKHLTPARRDQAFVDMSRRLFNTEAQILERLGSHEQIPNLLAYFEENQEFYLVQELVVGQPLDQELADTKEPWTEEKVIDFLRQMLPVLEHIHERGVIHRDVKPSNIIRRASDNVLVLIDFGAVKEINPEIPDAHTIALGTRGYTPAEQYAGHPRFGSDIYALGMTAIEAATNTSPREIPLDDQDGGLAWQELSPVSAALAAVIDKMVAYQFQNRYQRAADVLQDLQKISPQDVNKSA